MLLNELGSFYCLSGLACYYEPMVDNWERLLQLASEITVDFPTSVFIGGVAVAVYANRIDPALKEVSHDADFYLSRQDKVAMRERFPMASNPRLAKDSVTIGGLDLDVYVEHAHGLAIPYDQVFAFSETLSDIRVAAPEHLLILKLDAALDRIGSDKGSKDLRDLGVLGLLLAKPRLDLLAPFLTEERMSLLARVATSGEVFSGLNPHAASRLRTMLFKHLSTITDQKKINGYHL